MAGFRETLELDITGALQRVGQLESRLSQATQTFKVSMAKSLDDLSETFRIDVTADTSSLQRQIDAAVSQQTIEVDANAAPVTGAIDQAVDQADTEIQVTADTAPATASLHEFESQAKATATRVASQASGLLGGVALGAGLGRLEQAASDLEQAVGGTAAVFGDAADEVGRFAKNAAESVGLSERAAREATSQIGALFKGFGFSVDEAAAKAIELVGVGADLAATFGGTTADAVDALGAALRGETDPVERYGISLRQASIDARAVALRLADSTTSVSANARATAAFALIQEQAGDALGQFTREADSAAGQAQIAASKQEDAAADLGAAVLPVYAKVQEVIGAVAEAFGALPESVQTGLVALVAVGAVVGPITSVVSILGTLRTVAATGAAATAVETTATAAATVAFEAEAVSLAQAAAAAAALTTSLEANAVAQGTAGAAAAAGGGGLRAALGAASATSLATVGAGIVAIGAPLAVLSVRGRDAAKGVEQANTAIDRFVRRGNFSFDSSSFADFRGEIDRVNQAGQTLQEEFAATGIAEGQLRGRINAATQALNPYASQLQNTALAVDLLSTATGISTQQAYDNLQAGDAQAEANRRAEVDLRARSQAIDIVRSATQRLIDTERERFDQINNSFDTGIALRESLLDTRDALEEAAAATGEFGSSSEEAQRAVDRALSTIGRQADAAVADAEARNGDLQLSARETAEIQIAQLQSVADNLSPTSPIRRAVDEYIFALASVPTDIATTLTVTVDGVEETVTGIKVVGGIKPGAHATGGTAPAHQRFRGNEGGPGELIVANLSGEVVSRENALLAAAGAFGKASSGGGVVVADGAVRVDARGTDAREVVRRLRVDTMFALGRLLPP